MNSKDKIRSACTLILGFVFLTATILGYYKEPINMSEYCFISGMTVGLILIASFFYSLAKKRFFPEWIYADCMITVFVIFLATIILRLNLDGAFVVIHIVNPILLFLYWAIFCNHNRIKKHLLIATCLVFPLVYLMIAKIVQLATGNCPFPAVLIFEGNPLHLVIVYIVAVCLIFLLLSFILHFINRAIHKKTPQ